jgi:steroid delta-isomerase-like uncharacterized protein
MPMTAADTRALIERYLDAFNARSIAGMLAVLDEDVVHDVNQGGRRIGRDAFESWAIHMARCYEETVADVVVMTAEDGGRAAAEYTVRGIYRETEDGLPEARGQSYALPAGTFFEVDDGRITRVTTYYNLEDFIAQVSG